MPDLQSLLARVEAATGPDREIDADLCAALLLKPGQRLHKVGHPSGWGVIWREPDPPGADETVFDRLDHYTASVDSCLALAERALPAARVHMSRSDGYAYAELTRGYGMRERKLGAAQERADGELALTICAAILKAKIEEAAHG